MENNLFAVVDLGTNTFHLLVGYWDGGELHVVYRERHFVKLAAEGIETIGEASSQRAVIAATSIGEAIQRYTLSGSRAYATAALRTASNGEQLKQALEAALTIPISIIQGDVEASLIAKGVLAAGLPTKPAYLIMDIGGGSVEFIHVENGNIKFRESFPVGAQVLRSRFHVTEPFVNKAGGDFSQEEQLFAFLGEQLQNLLTAVRSQVVLVGASGTFDVLGSLYGTSLSKAVKELSAQQVVDLYTEAIAMDTTARFADERLPDDRADMIVVALALIVFILKHYPQTHFLTCDYAMKEGALLLLAEETVS